MMMKNLFNQKGQSLTEYALILVSVAIGLVLVLGLLRTRLDTLIRDIIPSL